MTGKITHSLDLTIPPGQGAIATHMLQRSTDRTLLIHMDFVNFAPLKTVAKIPQIWRRASSGAASGGEKKRSRGSVFFPCN
ncbi:hypothetical protein [Denitromonas ohlonensis]|uniref:Uncharacterized protein n=2 Tax=Denitromonas TaxID=139331 RepID=A0A557RBZ6_9RHOO|nr:hypothetical protein [Denitromonas ohlonensis]TVO62683.1 hypothetical protein FHP90_16825 [Denitromonas ohlonensis]TVO78887.1 hypothetical protein FHP89_04305 [Denitromonas ohlonensis]TVT49321.1 MAG: hypothetical protein FHP94_06945 [Denitromonas halophila]TVT74526.1 MAG: hypothetical protein FHP93_03835 [Denitromonas halophila]